MREYRTLIMRSKELNRDVRIFIYLPKSYDKTDRFYPVLYMHDGQNLFDDALAYGNTSWGIIKSYEENPDLPEVIIVGIENGGEERSNELVPFTFRFKDYGMTNMPDEDFGGKADIYLQFITTKVKPYIDKTFRTFKSPKNTALMGSSFGGLNTLYASMMYTEYFSRFGCVSNAFYVVQEQIEKLAQKSNFDRVKKIYLDVGTKETSRSIDNEMYVESNNAIYDILRDKIDPNIIQYKVIENGVHNEGDWEKRFPEIIQFLFND